MARNGRVLSIVMLVELIAVTSNGLERNTADRFLTTWMINQVAGTGAMVALTI
jgi:hypothetical protein